MAPNAIRFQKGFSEMMFQANYGTQAQCETVLEAMRWPDGFACTVIEGTKLPMGIWLRGVYPLTQTKNVVPLSVLPGRKSLLRLPRS